MVESESFRSTSTTQLLKRVRRSDSNSPPREVPNKYRRVDFFPNRQEAEEEDVVQIQKEPNPPPIVNRQDDEVSVITPLKRRIPGLIKMFSNSFMFFCPTICFVGHTN